MLTSTCPGKVNWDVVFQQFSEGCSHRAATLEKQRVSALPIGTAVVVVKGQTESLISGQIINTSRMLVRMTFVLSLSLVMEIVLERKKWQTDRRGEWEREGEGERERERKGVCFGGRSPSGEHYLWLIYCCVVWGCDTEREETAMTKKKKLKHREREREAGRQKERGGERAHPSFFLLNHVNKSTQRLEIDLYRCTRTRHMLTFLKATM